MTSTGARIERVLGRRVWDSRGRPTVEAEIVLDTGARGRAMAPAGASTGRGEAVDLRDGGASFGGLGVDRAVANVRGEMASALRGWAIADQAGLDRRLIELDGTPNKARLGGNAMIAVSMAAVHAAAAAAGEPLWRYLSGDVRPKMPVPMVQVFGGGAHAGRRVDIQDFLVIPVGAATFDAAIARCAEIYAAAGRIMAERGRVSGVADEGGWWPEFTSTADVLDTLVQAIERAGYSPGADAAIAIDVAASQFARGGRYVLAADGLEMDSDGLVAWLVELCDRYPIISVEDPVAEDDDRGMHAFTTAVGDRVQVIGDDYLVSSASRVTAAASRGACNAVLLKPNQAGTVTETLDALHAARAAGWRTVVSARSGETEDVTVVHLAVAWAADQLKVGSMARGERTAKWNEGVRIEEELRHRAI